MKKELNLHAIDPGRECLKFIETRLKGDNYRGNQISQHNRYDLKIVKEMLKTLYDISGKELMQIRDSDLSKRPANIAGEENYAKYVSIINNNSWIGRGTQDSVRKNLFVDFARMGFINRYDKNRNLTNPFKRSVTKYVSLSDLGFNLINSDNIFEEYMLYTRGIDNLMGGLLDDLLDITLLLKENKITEDEYTFIVSFVNQQLKGKYYGKELIVDLVKDYRSMSRYQKESVKNLISEYCNPKNFRGVKTNKRDYHNWLNETQQVFMLLDQTVYFEQRGKDIVTKIGNTSVFENNKKLLRSLSEKQKYFKYHNNSQAIGFELHHIVPLCWAKCREEFTILDNHKNLVYIDGFSHSKITQNGNKNVVLNFDKEDVIFVDIPLKYPVKCVKNKQILYSSKNQTEMLEYNKKLLKDIS